MFPTNQLKKQMMVKLLSVQQQLFCRLLRDQWIRAKYERKEFLCVEKQEPYSAGKG